MESYLKSSINLFAYYKLLGEKAMAQLGPEQLFYAHNENTNSIWIIVKHISGNMLSRWTDFLTSDGEKDWRNRDSEFDDDTNDANQLKIVWEKGWACLFDALNGLTEADLQRTVYIRNEGHTVVEAVNRQLAHYSYHVGQIVFYAKLLKSGEWDSLSIAKNKSKQYNDDKFSKDKSQGDFTSAERKRLQ